MGYLLYLDYQKQIQDANFQQVIASNDALRLSMERAAQAEVISYLIQKYDVSQEFRDTSIYSNTAIYKAGSLVQLSGYYIAWTNINLYIVGDFVSYSDGNIYRCNTNTTVAHEVPTNVLFWDKVGSVNDLFYIAYPYPLFDETVVYAKDDIVFWTDKIYKCQVPTVVVDEQNIQLQKQSETPSLNIFPDDKINGKQYWGVGTAYSVTGLVPNATSPAAWSSATAYTIGARVLYNGLVWKALLATTNIIPGVDIVSWQPETWVTGDNRDQQLVLYMVDICIFHLLSRIAPRNIPELRVQRYTAAKEWLQMAANGAITAAIKEIQPAQGNRIRSGGGVKNNWG